MALFNEILDNLLDALKDTALVTVFLFAAFVVIGLLERGIGRRMVSIILTADKIGPLFGGILGALPSCGFSAAASNLYSVGVLTSGTLLSVYLTTSDEMIAVMVSNLSNGASIATLIKILLIKIVAGIVFGFAVDGVIRLVYHLRQKKEERDRVEEEAEELADEAYECACGDPSCAVKGNLFVSAIQRTLKIALFIFIITALINVAFIFVDKSVVADFIARYPVLGCILSALCGLIPNCAVSVFLTEFYLNGIITAPIMLCGLMTGAGSGLLVLFNRNMNMKENVFVVSLLFVGGLLLGSLGGLLLQVI